MSKVKSVAWSPELTENLVTLYAQGEGESLEAIAKELGKTVPAVRSKLVSEGVYVKQTPRAVGGASPVRKIALVKQVATMLEVEFEELESLEKASKASLEALLEALKPE